MATKTRKYVLRSHFSGFPQRDALEIVEEDLPALKDGGLIEPLHNRHRHVYVKWLSLSGMRLGRIIICYIIYTPAEFLCEAQWLSVDPYMR